MSNYTDRKQAKYGTSMIFSPEIFKKFFDKINADRLKNKDAWDKVLNGEKYEIRTNKKTN